MIFHVYRASDSSGESIPLFEGEEEIAEWKAKPPCPNAEAVQSVHILGWAVWIWQIQLNTLEDAMLLHPRIVIRTPHQDHYNRAQIVIYDYYIE